jgi:hypothetical protein
MPRKTTTVKHSEGSDGAVSTPSSQLEFRKSNEAIGLRVVEGRLTLLNRKVFNVLVYHAQQIRMLGERAPVDTASAKKYFWVPLSELARDARYDSRDMQFLREQIEEMQDIKLRLETDRQWTSERLIASVTFVNPKGLRSKTGQVWVGFAFPPEVHENVMRPGTFTKLSIYYQGLLRSGPSLALYEICRRYATNPSKVTSVDTYEHWYGVLTGNPVPQNADDLPAYKYFKRDVLNKAIAEVNALTDIVVELIEHKYGRRVVQLQFKVDLAKQPQLEFPTPPIIDVTLLEKLMGLGLSQNEAADVLAQYPDTKVSQALAVVDARAAAKNSTPIESKAAYFRWALKKDVKPPEKATPRLAGAGTPDGPSLLERFRTARAKIALDVFKELEDTERDEVYEQFIAQSKMKPVPMNKALDHGVTRTALGLWYAQNLWGEPNIEDLSYFADKNQIPFGDSGT